MMNLKNLRRNHHFVTYSTYDCLVVVVFKKWRLRIERVTEKLTSARNEAPGLIFFALSNDFNVLGNVSQTVPALLE
jgi:hypothetical protein